MRVDVSGLYLTELRVSKEGKLIKIGPYGPSETDYVWSEITKLQCSFNRLTSLPSLPKGLKKLNCSYNHLTSLPPLPEGMRTLECSKNQLTSLPSLPEGLGRLECSYNQLTSLPSLPEGLGELYCSENLLASLPSLPGGMRVFGCSNNPFDQGVDIESVPLRFRGSVPLETYGLYVALLDQRKEQFRKMLLALPGRPRNQV